MEFKEGRNARVGIDLIFNLREAMTFVVVDLHLDVAAALLDSFFRLPRLGGGAARVVTAGEHQQRRLDAV
jgi:hypothetical protein